MSKKSKKLSKADKQLKNELFDFLSNAIKHTRDNKIPKTKLAEWLYTKNIAIKNMVFDKQTFIPHVIVEYNDEGKLKEFTYDLTMLENRSAEEIWKDIQDDAIEKQNQS